MLIHNADITGSLTINGVPYTTGSFSGSFIAGTNIMSANTVSLTGSFTGSFFGDGSQLSGVTSYTDADTLSFIQGYSGSYSGSFFGDGSNLTGVTSYTDADTLAFINSLDVVSGSIQTVSTVSDTFTSATSYTVTHNFGTKEVIVSVYENDTLIFPSSINTPTTNTVTITFPEPVTGRVVVVKAGHIVSGSINYNSVLNKPTLVSGSSQISFTGITNKPTLVSGSSQITYSGLTGVPSGIVSGSSQVTYSGLTGVPSGIVSGSAQVAQFGYATTGSNQFKASQTITGSLTVTGAIVAQTLNVQQVTSSVVFSSGSNRFGNNTGNTHQFTGSVGVTGSVAVAGAGTFSSSVTSDDLILTAGTLFSAGNTGFSNRLSDTTLYLQMPATGFNITDNALNTKFILSSTGAATFNLGSGEMRLNRAGTAEYLKLNTYYLLTDGNDQLLGSITGATNIYAGSGASPKVTIASTGAATFTQTGGSFLIDVNGHFTSRQNLDVATAGGRFVGQSARGTMGHIQIDQVTTGADGGRITFLVSPSGSTTPALALTLASTGAATFSNSVAINGSTSVDSLTVSRNVADNAGGITLYNADTSGYGSALTFRVNYAGVYNVSRIHGDWGTGNSGLLHFFTANTSQTLVERMTIDGSGNVGINTDSPGSLLSIKRGASGDNMELIGSGASGYSDILFYNTNKVARLGYIDWSDTQVRWNVEANIPLAFYTNATTRMTITSAGNVIIGNTTAYGGLTVSDFTSNDGNDSLAFFYRGTSGGHESLIKFYDFRGQVNAAIGNNLEDDGIGTQKARLVFKTSFSGAPTERMQITSEGRISINTASAAYHQVAIKSNGVLTYQGLGVYSSSNDRWISINHTGTEGFVETENGGSGVMTPLSFKTGGSTRLTIDTSGRIITTVSGINGQLQVFQSDANYNSDAMFYLFNNRNATSGYNFAKFFSGYPNNTNDVEFAFRGDGTGYSDGGWTSPASDYAEYFESVDGTALQVGSTVVLENGKIRQATESDTNIIGAIRPKNASLFLGNNEDHKWNQKYLKDDFGAYILDSEGMRTLNPEYNPDIEYVSREKRDEWNVVGLVGQIPILKSQPVGSNWVKMYDVSSTVEMWLIK